MGSKTSYLRSRLLFRLCRLRERAPAVVVTLEKYMSFYVHVELLLFSHITSSGNQFNCLVYEAGCNGYNRHQSGISRESIYHYFMPYVRTWVHSDAVVTIP